MEHSLAEHAPDDGRALRRPRGAPAKTETPPPSPKQPQRPARTGSLAVSYRKLAALTPYDKNPRTHPRSQLDKIKASMRRFGWTNPLLIADGGIIAGHGRLIAAAELAAEGFATKRTPSPDLAPIIDLSHLTPAERRAYVLADNRIALDSGWDEALLAGELQWLDEIGFDLADTGFADGEIESLLAGLGLPSGASGAAPDHGALAARFGVPPFSVLNAREGWWQDRKRAWISLGIRSELGRGEGTTDMRSGAVMPIGGGLANKLGASMAAKKRDMTRSGAVMPIKGDPKQNLLRARGYKAKAPAA
jgi:ParB-like nuclease domain